MSEMDSGLLYPAKAARNPKMIPQTAEIPDDEETNHD